jgi:predicted RND superfamily exporter protein
MTRYLVSGRIGGSEKLAGDPTELRRLWRHIEFARGVERRQEIVNDALDQGLVTIFLKNANYADSARLMAQVRQFAAETLAPLGGRVHFAGDVAVSQAMIAANVRGQLQSIGFGVVTLFAFLLLVLRRVSAALFAVVPVSVACLAVLGLMGWLGIPVGVATSMFIAITLGIGIDFPLHLLQRIERERAAGAPDPIGRAKAIIGPAIVIDSLVVSAGFGTLVFSQVPANARLGALVAITVLACCACTLLLTRSKRQRAIVVTAST